MDDGVVDRQRLALRQLLALELQGDAGRLVLLGLRQPPGGEEGDALAEDEGAVEDGPAPRVLQRRRMVEHRGRVEDADSAVVDDDEPDGEQER
ncbi:MAG: hypothetical protein KY443_05485 [Actinobacteria bacterium]|nr:hypothetical protein [Actinomycetota bacterium]